MRWKKHTKDERTSNYPTKQAQDYHSQQNLPFMPEEAARLDAGWQPNLLFTDFRALLSHPRGIGLDPWWVMDLLDPAAGNEIRAGTQLSVIPPAKKMAETKKRVRVKPKPIKKITEAENE